MPLPSVQEMEAYIRQAAIKRGIDPDVAVRVARTEGLARNTWQSNVIQKDGRREPSFGPFQMHMEKGLGRRMMTETGVDPSNPANWRQGVDYSLNTAAAKRSWGDWYGARDNGIPNNAGFGGKPGGMGALPPSQQPAPPKPMGTAMSGFSPQQATQAPTMTASVNPMQGAPGTPPGNPGGMDALFGAAGSDKRKKLAEALMGGMNSMGGTAQQPMQPANFVVPAAEPGSINPTPQGGEDPRMAMLMRLLQQG